MDPDFPISGGYDRGFPGIQGCGHLIQLFDQLILAKLLQLVGLVLDFRLNLDSSGVDLRKRFSYIFGGLSTQFDGCALNLVTGLLP